MRPPDDADVFNALRRLSKEPRTQYYNYVQAFVRKLSRVLTPTEKLVIVEAVTEGRVPTVREITQAGRPR